MAFGTVDEEGGECQAGAFVDGAADVLVEFADEEVAVAVDSRWGGGRGLVLGIFWGEGERGGGVWDVGFKGLWYLRRMWGGMFQAYPVSTAPGLK